MTSVKIARGKRSDRGRVDIYTDVYTTGGTISENYFKSLLYSGFSTGVRAAR